jgi:peroxiredoxin
MKRIDRWHFAFAGLLLAALAQPVTAALKAGDMAPAFRAPASLDGKSFTFSLRDALQKGPVVIYFFPAAFTEGCNIQAHEFAVRHTQFVAAKATVIGVSLDSIARLNEFSADPDYCGGKVPVASDAEGRIAQAYDLTVKELNARIKDTRGVEIDHGFTERTTFVVTPDGRIAATIGGVSPVNNVEQALTTVRQLLRDQRSSP